jgi:hypothetical protein
MKRSVPAGLTEPATQHDLLRRANASSPTRQSRMQGSRPHVVNTFKIRKA